MRIPTALLLLLLPLAPEAAQRLYKWTDAQGNVHYTQTPPPSGQYEDREVRHADPAPPVAGAAPDPADARRAENCRIARQNLQTLQRADIVRMDRDGDGTSEALSPEERAGEIERTTAQVREFCGEE